MARRCPGFHARFQLQGSWTARASKYAPALAEAWASEAAQALQQDFQDLGSEDFAAAVPEDVSASETLWINDLLTGLHFTEHFCVPVPPSQHINVRELQSQVQLVKSIAVAGQWPCRALDALDSLVTRGVVNKGRSASEILNKTWRRAAPYSLGCGIARLNPGDDPSRLRAVRAPRSDLPQWVNDAEGIPDYGELDRWQRLPQQRRDLAEWARLLVQPICIQPDGEINVN